MKKIKCPECGKKMKFIKPDEMIPSGYYLCKHCRNMYRPIVVDVLKE